MKFQFDLPLVKSNLFDLSFVSFELPSFIHYPIFNHFNPALLLLPIGTRILQMTCYLVHTVFSFAGDDSPIPLLQLKPFFLQSKNKQL